MVLCYSGKYSELMRDLDETKARAHYLLYQQNTEITNTMVSVHQLISHLQNFHTEMMQHVDEVSSGLLCISFGQCRYLMLIG